MWKQNSLWVLVDYLVKVKNIQISKKKFFIFTFGGGQINSQFCLEKT